MKEPGNEARGRSLGMRLGEGAREGGWRKEPGNEARGRSPGMRPGEGAWE